MPTQRAAADCYHNILCLKKLIGYVLKTTCMYSLIPRQRHPFFVLFFYLLLFFFLSTGASSAQHTYRLSPAKDIPLLTAGAAGTATSIWLRSQNQPLAVDDIGMLKATDIFAIDRSAATRYGKAARTASDIFLVASHLFPLATLLVPDIRREPGTIAVMLAETLLINEALTGITKAVVRRPRPFTYNQEVPENIRTAAASRYSFFSGHTSYTAALSFFTAKVVTDHLDNRPAEAWVWAGAALWPAATGYFRYRAGMHFPTDVVVGYLVGAATGWLIPQLHKTEDEPLPAAGQLQRQPPVPQFRLVLVF